MPEHISQLRFKCLRNTHQTKYIWETWFIRHQLRYVLCRQTSKRMNSLTCRGVNPSKSTVYNALRPYCRPISLTGRYSTYVYTNR